jgi:alpha-mannosidase
MHTDLLSQTLPYVKGHIHPASMSLPDWKLKEGEIQNAALPSLNDATWWNYTIPAPWGGYDKTAWFRKTLVIPEGFAGRRLGLVLDIPDALLYVNGEPFHGIDKQHQAIHLTEKARTNQVFHLAIEAYSGRKKELSTFSGAHLVVINPVARALYHGLLALHDMEKVLGPSSGEMKEIKELIRQTLIFLKYFKPDGEEYPNAIGRAYNFLTRTLQTEYKTSVPGLVHLVAQSHIDVVWLWKLRETRKKCARTFSTALRLMEDFPDFNFTQSQAYFYQLMKDSYPDIFKEIKQRVAEGRWYPVGSMWVEPDCNIPNGESLVRQILHGKRFFKKEFGIESDTLWLPDTFGYSWALPQIMRKSGIRYFFTTKMTWNDTNPPSMNTFWWCGIDGSKVLAHNPQVGLEGSISPKDLKKSWETYHEREKLPHTMQTFGYGDGGGGPTTEQIEASYVLKTLVGMPTSTLSSASQFFKTIEEQSKELDTWNDELYLEKHRGTFTTHGWVKKENRRAETSLYTAELLAVLGFLAGQSSASRRYPQQHLESAWKRLLLNQFHDILPGTAIPEAYDDAKRDFEAIHATCQTVQKQFFGGFVQKEAKRKQTEAISFSVFNPTGWERSDYLELQIRSGSKSFLILDSKGGTVEHQVLGRKKGAVRILCYVENIPAFSFSELSVLPSDSKPAARVAWKMTNRQVETPQQRVRFDSRGQISSLYDKTLRRELIAEGARANQLQAFKDTPKQWEAWDIDSDYPTRAIDLLKLERMRIVEQGPLRATIRIELRSENKSRISQEIQFYHKSRRIDFQTSIHWREHQTLLKVAFPLRVKSHMPTYEIQFGAIQRTSKPTDSRHKAKFEVPAQQWADLSEAKFGVSLLNNCKYGYDASDNTLRLTLLRSPHYPHPIEPWRLNDDRFTDQGEHSLTYSLYPHPLDWGEGQVPQRARELNHPLLVVEGTAAQIPSLVSISSTTVLVDSIKKAEDNDEIIIRLHEAVGQAVKTTLTFGLRADAAVECDLMEQDQTPLKIAKSKLSLKFSAFEIKTIRVKFRPKR